MEMYDALIIGAEGMVGSALYRYLRKHTKILGTSRNISNVHYLYLASRDRNSLKHLLSQLNPNGLVINCAAVLEFNEKNSKLRLLEGIETNAVFPHLLSELCDSTGMRLIHISTDAVFGNTGYFIESSTLAPNTTYGFTKALGEVGGNNSMTIRCSLIGPSYGEKKSGLWNWIVESELNEKLNGYVDHYWNGVTTLQFARVCYELLDPNCFFHILKNYGTLHHLCVENAITKYELICKISKRIRPDLRIEMAVSKKSMNRQLISKEGKLNQLVLNNDWDVAIDEIATW